MTDFPALPMDEIKSILTELEKAHGEAKSALLSIGSARASVANMEIVYKDSYSRRSLDAVASRAISEVMAASADLAEQKAADAADAKRIAKLG